MSNIKNKAVPEENKGRKKSEINVSELCVKNIQNALTIKGHNVKILLNVIRSLQFTNNTEIQFSQNGMKFIAEESQFFQGIAYFSPEFFQRFHYMTQKDILVFGVDLTAFSEFFSALIDNELSSLKIIYYGEHRPVAFIFTQIDNDVSTSMESDDLENDEEINNEIITEYIVKTKHSINPIEFNLDLRVVSKFVINAADFMEIIIDLDRATEELQLRIDRANIIFRSLGIVQCNTQIEFSSDHKIFKKFEHFEDSKFNYKFSCFRSMKSALGISSTLSVETKENGMLKLQMMGKSGVESEDSYLYYEFNIMPNVEEDIELVVD